jgi:diaminohydroxyphosphoribosylaminopyrimidine deaminase/5-amino-6-(5-phosphoribosylamino)uracil reductase
MHQPDEQRHLMRAITLAEQGRGLVEPNPQVGCLVVRDGQVVGEGWHPRLGGPHAEVVALQAAGERARGADLFVTLEPCCHQGKTPPCTEAILRAEIARVVIGCQDPNPQVAGGGIARLRAAGIAVQLADEPRPFQKLIAPFAKLVTQGRPWVIAKWAMTLDGKLATATGSSRWISNEASRAVVQQLRGRVDAILVGKGTALADDPALIARPAGPRIATRIVLDSQAQLPLDAQLIRTLDQAPLAIVAAADAPPERIGALRLAGAEVLLLPGNGRQERLQQLLDELGRRQRTNLLVEGGSEVLGCLFDLRAIDEVHIFIAPKLVGGRTAPTAIGGMGLAEMSDALPLIDAETRLLDDDIYLHGLVG